MSEPPRKRGRIRYPLSVALRLTALHRELNAQMKIRITEPVFFLGAERKIGDVLDNVEVGPYRTELSHTTPPGGLTRIPQFVEMPEEIKRTIVEAAAPASKSAAPQTGTFAEATAAVLKPTAPKPAASSLASQIAALATRRRKLNDVITSEVEGYGKLLSEVESRVPEVFTKARTKLTDESANLGDLDTSLTDFAGANGGDPLSG